MHIPDPRRIASHGEAVFWAHVLESIFHHEVEKALMGVPGCISIHDNILVFGATAEGHRNNLRAALERCREKVITLKLAKNTLCKTRVK